MYFLKQNMVEDIKLRRFVRSYWILKKSEEDVKIPKLFLLPSAHILINLGDDCFFKTSEKEVAGRGNQIFHASTHIWDIYYGRKTHIVGIELSPQGYYSLTGNYPVEKTDTIEALKEADQRLDKFIEKNKGELEKSEFSGLEEYLRIRLEPFYEEEDTKIIEGVIMGIEDGKKIIELPGRYNLSIRTLERKFKRYTGFTLKQYQLIVRLNKLLDDVYMNEDISWSELALKHGFFDQAHMIKVVKKYLGRTPGEYLDVRDLLGDIFMVE